jgi:hypothetical protein
VVGEIEITDDQHLELVVGSATSGRRPRPSQGGPMVRSNLIQM